MPPSAPAVEPAASTSANVEDRWGAQGALWLAEIRSRELWRDPDLSSSSLARELRTNTTYLSRALNEGLGQSFSECINRLRVEFVQEALRRGVAEGELLEVAIAAGFWSKASFNRVFKTYTDQTPTQYRQNVSLQASQIVNP